MSIIHTRDALDFGYILHAGIQPMSIGVDVKYDPHYLWSLKDHFL